MKIDRPICGLFACSWERAVFLHYEVEGTVLQPWVPFPLDRFAGKAYVSCVAFHLGNMRFRLGGKWTRWLTHSIAGHPFLNLRAYVKVGAVSGIYFLREWLPNRMSLRLGPLFYGLPYTYGDCRYRHFPETGSLHGSVDDIQGRRLVYELRLSPDSCFKTSRPDSLDAFLLERYHAFTRLPGGRSIRRFTVCHESWPQAPAEPAVLEHTLIASTGNWFSQARLIGAHYSPGFSRVGMGRPVLQPIHQKHEPSHLLS